MPTINASNTVFSTRTAEAVKAYLTQSAEIVAWRATKAARPLSIRCFDEVEALEFPAVVVRAMNLREAWAGSDEHRGRLIVCVAAQPDTPAPEEDAEEVAQEHQRINRAAVQSLSAAVSLAMRNQGALRTFVNAGNAARPVGDFHFYSFVQNGEDVDLVDDAWGRRWEIAFDLGIVCAECDYSS